MTQINEDEVAYPAPGSRTGAPAREYVRPHAVVLFGATGDLSRRKLLPGLARLSESRLAPEVRIVGTSLDDLDDTAFRQFARSAVHEFGGGKLSNDEAEKFVDHAIAQADSFAPLAASAGGCPRSLAVELERPLHTARMAKASVGFVQAGAPIAGKQAPF